MISQQGFQIVRTKQFRMTLQEAEGFYQEHRGRFFYPRLVNFITSGDIVALELEKDDAIPAWRHLIGPSHLNKQPQDRDTIRKLFAFSDTYNAVHGSDSPESAQREIEFIFGKE